MRKILADSFAFLQDIVDRRTGTGDLARVSEVAANVVRHRQNKIDEPIAVRRSKRLQNSGQSCSSADRPPKLKEVEYFQGASAIDSG